MRTGICISKSILHFSRWCGKGYAIFAALGKEIQISGLAVHICECALLKSAHKGVITTTAACRKEQERRNVEKCLERQVIFCINRGEVCPDNWEDVKI
ncbi:MAG: hypothetical protein RR397_04095 [Odoribacter sp.]